MIRVFLVTVTTIFTLQLQAQPTVYNGGVVNVASYTRQGLPSSSIAQGSMFTIFGENMGTTASATSFPLPNTLGETSVAITSGSTTVQAIMVNTTAGQVDAILPSSTPVGSATLTLTYNKQSSAPVDITIVPSSFGAFTQNQAGSGPGVIQQFANGTGAVSVNTILNPADPGQTVALWGTGLGPITGNDANAPAQVNMQTELNVKVWVGTQLATVTYAGRSSCCSGTDVVYFVVPQSVEGCYLPVAVQAGTTPVVSNFTSMAVEPSAGAGCSDADGIDPADVTKLQSAGSITLGSVDLTHISLALVAGITPVISDTAYGVFGTYSAAQFSASLGVTISPSVGTCTVSQFQGLDPLPVDPIIPALQDAGSALSIAGPNGTQKIASATTGTYSATLGGVPLNQILTATPTPGYLVPGSYTVSGTGGSAIGSFSESLTVPTDVTWNSGSITTVDRTKDLTITWKGGAQNDFVAISGTASVITSGNLGPGPTSPGNAFLCIAPASAGTFTVPSWVLQTLPSTAGEVAASFLLVGTQTPVSKFSASGLDDGYVVYRSLSGVGVPFE